MSFSFGTTGTAKAKPTAKKSSTPEREVVGIANLAALDTVLASVQAVRDDVEGEIKALNTAYFVDVGCVGHVKPNNFRGTENGSSASCELRKRSSRSSLSVEEIPLCDELGIGYKVVQDTIDTFIINPDYLQDTKVMGVLEKLLAAAVSKGQLPADIMQRQEGVSRTVLNDDALDVLFVKATPEVATRALPLVGTLALGKAKFNGSLKDAVAAVDKLMGSDLFRAKAEAAAEEGPKKKGKRAAAE